MIPGMKCTTERPNILFILADDLGFGDLQCYGNPYVETPNINALAAAGMRFTDHYAPSPLCAPSRAGYLTGRYNHRTGAIDVSSNRGIDRIALSEKTFGDYFRHAGYATALIGKWHNGLYCNDYLPQNRGFDLFYGFPNGQHDYWAWKLFRNEELEENDGRYMTDVFNQEAIRFIRESGDAGKPFAIWLAHHAPHAPLQAPEPLVGKYRERLRGEFSDGVATIYAMIEQMDTGLGWVFDELKRTGKWDNTIIVFTSDNGAFLQTGPEGASYYRYHACFEGNKDTVWEQGIRVPAIASWPCSIPSGRTESVPVHGCDWLPTLFSVTGCNPPEGAKPLDGVDLMPFLRKGDLREMPHRRLAFQKNRYTPVPHSDAALRDGAWKLFWPGIPETIRKDLARDNPSFERGSDHPHWEMPLDPGLPDYEGVCPEPARLFDLVADPAERRNLAEANPALVREMTAHYDAWFASVFADWKASFKEICEHDETYWATATAPDPRILFDDYWRWDCVPNADPARDDPLEVFKGFWTRQIQ
jgi:arylsulfatase A-like enzyme